MFTHSVREIMKYHTTSKQIQLVANIETMDKERCKRIKDIGATHVITEVTTGFNAYLLFEKEIEKHQTKKQIEGSLDILIKALPNMEIDGEAQINFNETENITRHALSFTFIGDAKLGKVESDFKNILSTEDRHNSIEK